MTEKVLRANSADQNREQSSDEEWTFIGGWGGFGFKMALRPVTPAAEAPQAAQDQGGEKDPAAGSIVSAVPVARSWQIALKLLVDIADYNHQQERGEHPDDGRHSRWGFLTRPGRFGFEMALRPGAREHSFGIVEFFARDVNLRVVRSAVAVLIVKGLYASRFEQADHDRGFGIRWEFRKRYEIRFRRRVWLPTQARLLSWSRSSRGKSEAKLDRG